MLKEKSDFVSLVVVVVVVSCSLPLLFAFVAFLHKFLNFFDGSGKNWGDVLFGGNSPLPSIYDVDFH